MYGEFPVTKILSELHDNNLLPAILFRSARKQCDLDIERLTESRVGVLPQDRQDFLRNEVDTVIEKYGLDREVIEQHPHFPPLLRTGIGAHHAGQLLVWRLVLEELMTRGHLRIMVATGTVAAGVDFPARTVVVTAHSKRGNEGFRVLTSSEFQQMSGRAGRRGKDTVGICLIAPSQYSDARVIYEVAKRPPEPLRSAYFAAPSTVLNLLKYRNVDDLRFTVSKSLAGFLDRKAADKRREEAKLVESEIGSLGDLDTERKKKKAKRVRRLFREADDLALHQQLLLEESLRGLGVLGYVQDGVLTDKGVWAAELCTTLVIELAEAIDSGLFLDLTMEELLGLLASISGDAHREYLAIKKNPIPKEKFEKLNTIVKRVQQTYKGFPFASEVAVIPDAAVTVLSWAEAESWAEFSGLIRLAGVADGDVARLISQTADHLHQISRLIESHPDLARLAIDARKLLLRPPIADAYPVNLAP